MTKFLNISTDSTLGGNSANDYTVSSQKAIKDYIDSKTSTVDVDNKTITQNSDNELQVEGIIEQNDKDVLTTWKGTIEEYDLLESKDPNGVYLILDDDNIISDTKTYCYPILTPIWMDHIVNEASFLRAEPFSWHYNSIYKAAYKHLVNDLATAGPIQTDTIAGIEISFRVASDKHRICLSDQENAISQIYENTGVAWFYILDTEKERFKLPRSKHNKYSEILPLLGTENWNTNGGEQHLSLPDVNGNYKQILSLDGSGLVYYTNNIENQPFNKYQVNLTQDTDQYKYLYFYVGNFEQSAIKQTAGLNTELFNGKMDSGTPLTRDIFSPDEWENNSMEDILLSPLGTGTINFTKNWQEFDYLWFSATADSATTVDDSPHWLNVKWLLSEAKRGVTNLAVIRYANTSWWYVNPQTWTETTMPLGTASESLYINHVYGIKLKNRIAKNVGLLNYKGLFATSSDLIATLPTDMGQWAIVQNDETQNNLQTKYFSTKDVNNNYVWMYGGVIDTSLVGADYVVDSQIPIEENNYTWYRKYKSGWVEQGGMSTGSYNDIIKLPIEMKDINYYVNSSCYYGTDNVGTATVGAIYSNSLTTSTIQLQRRFNGAGSIGTIRWEVKGQAA